MWIGLELKGLYNNRYIKTNKTILYIIFLKLYYEENLF